MADVDALRMPPGPRLRLQRCDDCGATSYPPRERCRHCLGGALAWGPCDGAGRVNAVATVAHSQDPAWRERLPVAVASVALDSGPVAFAFAPLPLETGGRCRLFPVGDSEGLARLVALPPGIPLSAVREALARLQLEEFHQ